MKIVVGDVAGSIKYTPGADIRSAGNGVVVVDRPERHLDLDGRSDLAAELIFSRAAVIFTSNDIDFINTVATHVADAYGGVFVGNWAAYLTWYKVDRIVNRRRMTPYKISLIPPVPAALATARFVFGGAEHRVMPREHVLVTGAGKHDFLVAAAEQIGSALCDGPVAGGVSPAIFLARKELLDALEVPRCNTINMKKSERARVALAVSLQSPVVVLCDPTKYLRIDQIYALIEHLRGRSVIFSSEDSAFCSMMRPREVKLDQSQ